MGKYDYLWKVTASILIAAIVWYLVKNNYVSVDWIVHEAEKIIDTIMEGLKNVKPH